MGIWEILHKKHGHRKDKIIQELLEQIKKMEDEAILAEQNEHLLIKQNQQLYRDLQKCLHPKKPHGARFDVVFP